MGAACPLCEPPGDTKQGEVSNYQQERPHSEWNQNRYPTDYSGLGAPNPAQAVRNGPAHPVPISVNAPPPLSTQPSGGRLTKNVSAYSNNNSNSNSLWQMFGGAQSGAPYESIAQGLKRVYEQKLLPLEQDSDFARFHSPELPPAYFTCQPIILTIGQYSTGKTSFIQHLLEMDYPGLQIGPEPTTDRFVAVCHGDDVQVIPGNALIYDKSLPFTPLSTFGNVFLSRMECARVPATILQGVSFIDTPGVLSGEKQRLSRGYNFEEVMTWFSEHAEMILLFFDAHKLDISDEFRRCIACLKGCSHKVRIILNKADQVTTQELVRVHGALMWSLGKVLDTPEVSRVYIGSFWDEPLQNDEQRNLFDREKHDLYQHIEQLPRSSSVQKINDLSKRARLCKAHAAVLDNIYTRMPNFFGYEAKKREIVDGLGDIYREVAMATGIPAGDFPDIQMMRQKLDAYDFAKLKRTDTRKVRLLEELLSSDIPGFLGLVPGELAEQEALGLLPKIQRDRMGMAQNSMAYDGDNVMAG